MNIGFTKTFNLPGSSLHGKPTNFKEKILGAPGFALKVHTIREDAYDRWREGMLLHMAYGVRSSSYECFNKAESGELIPGLDKCRGTQLIEIRYHEECANAAKNKLFVYSKPYEVKGTTFYIPIMVFMRNKPGEPERALSIEQMQELAVNDGFASLEEFFEWFSDSFKGKLIHWTEKRY